jgi:regulator of protease activity HflC (stomatin/prohibitin superfamily)
MNQQPQLDVKKLRPLLFVVLGVIILLSIGKFWVTIPSGHAGVIYKKFGNGVDVNQKAFGQGLHVIAPWNDMLVYEIRQSERTETMTVLSSNLLEIKMDITLFYQPIVAKLGYLEVERGNAYETAVVLPVIRSVVREVLAKYMPEQINTTKREEIKLEILDVTKAKLMENYVQLNDILIRNITLPDKLRASIEKKLQQEQEALEYEFKIDKEKLEADRKRIEAQGIQDFQKIITQSINDKLLRWNGIEATLKLAESNNAKVIVVGSGKDGLPLILGGN